MLLLLLLVSKPADRTIVVTPNQKAMVYFGNPLERATIEVNLEETLGS